MIKPSYTYLSIILSVVLYAGASSYAEDNIPSPTMHTGEAPTVAHQPIWKGSLMFGTEDVQALGEALKLYRARLLHRQEQQGAIPGSADTLSSSSNTMVPLPPYMVPSFYFNANIYSMAELWSLWINNVRLDKGGNKVGDILVKTVQPGHGLFVLQTDVLDYLSPQWEKALPVHQGNRYSSTDGKISVDAVTGEVQFILSPNQTFVFYDMKVVEGIVPLPPVPPAPPAQLTTVAQKGPDLPDGATLARQLRLPTREDVANYSKMQSGQGMGSVEHSVIDLRERTMEMIQDIQSQIGGKS